MRARPILLLCILSISGGITGCGGVGEPAGASIVGKWRNPTTGRIEIEFKEDGTALLPAPPEAEDQRTLAVNWTLDGAVLTVTGETGRKANPISVAVTEATLTMDKDGVTKTWERVIE